MAGGRAERKSGEGTGREAGSEGEGKGGNRRDVRRSGNESTLEGERQEGEEMWKDLPVAGGQSVVGCVENGNRERLFV